MWYKILLVLLWCSCLIFPVNADTLTGDETGTATGHTTVTARIEMPEGSDGDSENDGSDAKTGDTARPLVYMLLGGVCVALLATANRLKKRIEAE